MAGQEASHGGRGEMTGVSHKAHECGFTTIELVLVIVILGVISVVAIPRFFDRQTFDEMGYAQELAAAFRYAQKAAVASGCAVRVEVDAAGYRLRQQSAASGHCDWGDSAFPQPVKLSDGTVMDGSTPPGLAVAPAVMLVYDATGGTGLGSATVITVGGRGLTIEAVSGYVVTP
jgi:MSHA pilin protein MshC